MRKAIFIGLAVVAILTSCSSETCDTTTAKGAADCMCKYTDKYAKAMANRDEDEMMRLSDEMDAIGKEINSHISDGDYTQSEYTNEFTDCVL